jgi:ubiquinone/menaquinone biosynthesis C-methylase UbiE
MSDHLEETWKVFETEVLPTLKPGKTVLDIGCGPSKKIRDKLVDKGFNWIGLDSAPFEGTIIGTMEEIPFASHQFNVIFCCHTLEHSSHTMKALQEMKRVLLAGGTLFTSTPYPTYNQLFCMDKTHTIVPNQEQTIRLFEINGLRVYKSILNKPTDDPESWNIITIGTAV